MSSRKFCCITQHQQGCITQHQHGFNQRRLQCGAHQASRMMVPSGIGASAAATQHTCGCCPVPAPYNLQLLAPGYPLTSQQQHSSPDWNKLQPPLSCIRKAPGNQICCRSTHSNQHPLSQLCIPVCSLDLNEHALNLTVVGALTAVDGCRAIVAQGRTETPQRAPAERQGLSSQGFPSAAALLAGRHPCTCNGPHQQQRVSRVSYIRAQH